MSESMVGRVARGFAMRLAKVIYDAEDAAEQRDRYCDAMWPELRDQAEAAIRTMREPTPEMRDAGLAGNDPAEVWRAMIDRALAEE